MEFRSSIKTDRYDEKSALSEFFKGNIPISTSFWAYLVGSNLAASAVFALMKDQLLQSHAAGAYLFFLFLLNSWFIFTLIGTWRSNSKSCLSAVKKFIVMAVVILGFAKIAIFASLICYGFLLS